MMQLRNEMSMLRYRSGNHFSCPMVDPRADRRLPARRRAVSQPVRREHLRALPGHPDRVPVERRSTPPACCGRRSAATIRCCSSSTSTCTGRPTTRASIPGTDFMIPFGKASLRRDGTDVLVVTWGALVQRSLVAAQQAEKHGITAPCSICGPSCRTTGHAIAGAREADQPRRHRARRSADLRLRRRDRRPDRRRAVRASRCAGPARRRARHAGRLLPGSRGSHGRRHRTPSRVSAL